MDYVFIATAENTGERQGERMLGVFKNSDAAHEAVRSFDPWDGDERKPAWVIWKAFDRVHKSGAVHVTLYALAGDAWWKGSVIKYALK